MINRFVVYTESDLDSSPRIPGMSLARIYENRITPHLDSFFEDAGVDPERGEWRVRSGMPDNNTLSGVLQASLFSSDDPARIRLVGHVGTLDPSPN